MRKFIRANLDEVKYLITNDEDNLMVSLVEKFVKIKKYWKQKNNGINQQTNYSLCNHHKIDDLIDPRMNTVSSILKHFIRVQ